MARQRFGGSGFGSDPFQGEQVAKGLPYLLLALVLVVLLWKSFYTLRPHERAVVLRFGKKLTDKGPGLHFMIPFADQVVRLNMAEHRIRLPFVRDGAEEQPRSLFRADLPAEEGPERRGGRMDRELAGRRSDEVPVHGSRGTHRNTVAGGGQERHAPTDRRLLDG
jgi:hypothetical protein